LVLLNLACGLPAVMTWAAFGTVLRRAFSTPESARVLNRVMGLSLFAVAIWIAMPH
jgi:threonine/homoserine/homoserine lactone efflux protein